MKAASLLQNILDKLRDQQNNLLRFYSRREMTVYAPVIEVVEVDPRRYEWVELSMGERRIMSLLQEEFHFLEEQIALLRPHLSPNGQSLVYDSLNELASYVDRDGSFYIPEAVQLLNNIDNCYTNIHKVLSTLVNPVDVSLVLFPDTQALLQNPALHTWTLGEIPFQIILLPRVLADLDALTKAGAHPEDTAKAKAAIYVLKRLRRKGNLNRGIPLNQGVLLRTLAIEPDFEQTYSWLRSDYPLDQIIIAMVDYARQYPNRQLALVSSELSLQNKAEFSQIAFLECEDLYPDAYSGQEMPFQEPMQILMQDEVLPSADQPASPDLGMDSPSHISSHLAPSSASSEPSTHPATNNPSPAHLPAPAPPPPFSDADQENT